MQSSWVLLQLKLADMSPYLLNQSCDCKGCWEKTWTFKSKSDVTVSPASNMVEGQYIFDLKALSKVQKYFCTISGR